VEKLINLIVLIDDRSTFEVVWFSLGLFVLIGLALIVAAVGTRAGTDAGRRMLRLVVAIIGWQRI